MDLDTAAIDNVVRYTFDPIGESAYSFSSSSSSSHLSSSDRTQTPKVDVVRTRGSVGRVSNAI